MSQLPANERVRASPIHLRRLAPGHYTTRDRRFAITRFAQVTGGHRWWWFDRALKRYDSRDTLPQVRRALEDIYAINEPWDAMIVPLH